MMILHNVVFGSANDHPREDQERVIQEYLGALFHAGQACGEYFFTWTDGQLNAHILLAGHNARARRYHSKWGKEALREVVRVFGQEPVWRVIDDDAPKRNTTWRGAPFLFLATHAFDWDSPVCRGDTGRAIPLYTLPIDFNHKQGLHFWQRAYQNHDNFWFGSGALEIPAYKQLALPDSELSLDGRDLCKHIEAATGVETYYYLMRYWGRRKGDEKRRCPGCGGAWSRPVTEGDSFRFFDFPFMCKKCRLVSHAASCNDDERYAHIGEYRSARKKRTRR